MTDDPIRMDYDGILHGRIRADQNAARDTPKDDPLANGDVDVGKYVVVRHKGAKALDIEVGTKPVESVQYMHITHYSRFTVTGDEHVFWFIFGTQEKHRVTVYGRRLRDAFNRINDHCVRILRQADRAIDPGGNDPFIRKIEVTLLPPDWNGED